MLMRSTVVKAPVPAIWEPWLLVAITLACLAPFISKPAHIDDPLFIWTARHIVSDPGNFYGFNVHWYSTPQPMSVVMQNPPLASYYMALAGSCLGWSEVALHIAFLPWAVAVVLGVYYLAREFCGHPFLAALASLAAPAFLVSSTSLMCDVMMLAFWVWAVFLWMRGLAARNNLLLFIAMLLAAASTLAKYFGLSLAPLLVVYAIMTQRRAGWWNVHLCFFVLVLAGYEVWSHYLYGKDLLFGAVNYATQMRVGGNWQSKVATGLCFTGGCLALVLFAIPLLWGWRGTAIAAGGTVLLALILGVNKSVAGHSVVVGGGMDWLFIWQWAIFVAGGAAVLALAACDLARNRDAKSTMLFLWIGGSFFFASLCNWTVAARNILPMTPAAAFLLVRGLENSKPSPARALRLIWCPWALALALSLYVALADFQLAGLGKTAAESLHEKLGPLFKSVYFEGHWGFQYYLQQLGGIPLDKSNMHLSPTDAVILPLGNSNIFPLSQRDAALWNELDLQYPARVAIMSGPAGAGFYSDGWGPAPYLIGPPPVERYLIYRGQ